MASVVEKTERKMLKIKSVGQPASFGSGDGKKLSFAAEDGLSYTTFVSSLFELVVVGAELDSDVELRKSGDYTNWILVQVYKDGKAMAEKKKWGGGGGGYRGKSPEEIDSIENQVRAKIVSDLWVGKAVTDSDELVIKLRAWLNKLGARVPKSAPAPTPAPVEAPKQPALGESPPEQKDPLVTRETLATLKSTVDASEYKDVPLSISALLLAEFGVKKAKELTDKEARDFIDGLNKGKYKG